MVLKSNIHKCLFILIIGLLSMYALAACSTSTVPPSTTETGGPTLTWKVFNVDDRTTQTYNGNATIKTQQGAQYTVTLLADDAGGVHQITLGSSTGWQCISDGVAKNVGPSLDKTDTQNLNPDSHGKVLTSIFLIHNVSFGPFDCQAGYTVTGAGTSLFGTSTNFSNQKKQAVLVFTM